MKANCCRVHASVYLRIVLAGVHLAPKHCLQNLWISTSFGTWIIFFTTSLSDARTKLQFRQFHQGHQRSIAASPCARTSTKVNTLQAVAATARCNPWQALSSCKEFIPYALCPNARYLLECASLGPISRRSHKGGLWTKLSSSPSECPSWSLRLQAYGQFLSVFLGTIL